MDILKMIPRLYYTLDGTTYTIVNTSVNFNISKSTRESQTLFLEYSISDGESIRDLAERVYDERELYWVIAMVNGFTNIVEDWPKTSSEIYENAVRVFGYDKIDEVACYVDPSGNIMDIQGLKFLEGLRDDEISDAEIITKYTLQPVTRFELIDLENENKRKIKLLDPDYVGSFVASIRRSIDE